ncbi:MAG: hypothetical protein QOF58_1448 [Pseudonocardiales bacterium]|jgi:hypothetical protein|nr:hypothetical protein [Pseudonocardiales bacterium]
MWPFDDIGDTLGGPLKDMITTGFEATMTALWKASLFILQAAFGLADQFSVFTVDTRSGPVSILWPLMLWISGVLALGLFFWQLTVTTLRGGRGFFRLVVGPVQYGVALAVTVGIVAAFLAGVDGVTEGILKYGLNANNFTDALNATGFLDAAGDGVNGTVLGIAALIGVIPASIGYVLEMLFREAAIYVIVATIPISAAGLLAGVTSTWFWRSARWAVACIVMKPVLALALVLGIAISGGSQGLSGLLAGIGVLIISLFCPFVLFKLFAFIDPNSDAGATFRNALSGVGVDSYGANNPAAIAGRSLNGGGGGGEAMEDANTDRYDEAEADYANNEMDNTGTGQSSRSGSSGNGQDTDPDSSANTNSGNASGTSGGADPADDNAAAAPPPANSGSVVSSSPTSGPSGDYGTDSTSGGADPPDNGGGASGGAKSSGGGGGAAAGAEEAAVIV